MNTKQKQVKNRKEERGIALIMTLGILSMLLVLALAFASSARTERKAAAANADVVAARLLAESAMERVVALMNIYDQNAWPLGGITSNYQGIDLNSNVTNETDWIHHLDTELDGTSLYTWSNDTAGTDQPRWENIAMDDRIVGRIAYRVIDGSGRLDPAACVKTAINESSAINQERPGVDVDEIMLSDADPAGSFITAAKCTALGYTDAGGTLPGPPNGRWTDFPQLFSAPCLNITDKTTKAKYYSVLALNQGQTREAFWIDDNVDGKKDSGEFYKRFNLARTDWNNGFASDGLGAENDQDGDADIDRNDDSIAFMTDYILNNPLSFPTANDPSPATIGDGIKWINDWSEVGTFVDAATRKKQIAANLIDYCDDDGSLTDDPSLVTYKFNPTRDSDTDPTYTGLEKTPYINEIGINVECTMTVNTQIDGTGTMERFDFQYDFTSAIDAEKIDIYSGTFSKGAILTILEGSITYTWVDAIGITITDTESLNGISLEIADDADAYAHLAAAGPGWTKDAGPIWSGWQPVATPDLAGSVTNVKVQLQKVSLHYDANGNNVADATEFADFAKPDKAIEFSDILLVLVDGATLSNHSWFSYQANDPRQNLNPDDWSTAKAELVGAAGSYGDGGTEYGTPDAVNDTTIPIMTLGITGDTETTTDPGYAGAASNQHVSTAYIANLPMASPWELGAIHRGAAWETLNFQKYNALASGGGVYADGDANILDQIKMSADYQKYGKVNVNTNVDNVLRALLGRIMIGNQYADPGDTGGGGNQVTIGSIESVVIPGIKALTSATATKRRSEIAQVLQLFDASCGQIQDTDALKEELIGKFINLTTAEPSNFSVIVLTQAIKDIGDPGGNITIIKDLDFNGDTTGNASEAAVSFDIDGDDSTDDSPNETISGCKNKTYNQYADEILAEQKILVYTNRDPATGKWKIVRYEYLEE